MILCFCESSDNVVPRKIFIILKSFQAIAFLLLDRHCLTNSTWETRYKNMAVYFNSSRFIDSVVFQTNYSLIRYTDAEADLSLSCLHYCVVRVIFMQCKSKEML